MVTILGFSIYWISICAFTVQTNTWHDLEVERPYPIRKPGIGALEVRSKAEKAEAATRTSRAPRSTPHCVHPSNEHPRTVKDRFEPFPRRAGAVPTTLSTRDPDMDPDRGAGTVRGYFVLRSNSIKFKRRTQMRETRVLKTTDVSRSVPVAVSRPQPG